MQNDERLIRVGSLGSAKTYITDLTHFLNGAGELSAMPPAVRKMAAFLALIIEAVTQDHLVGKPATGVRCRKRSCKGLVMASMVPQDEEIIWSCPSCGENGVIRNWQGTKWDHAGEAGATSLAVQSRAGAEYTPKEGQYLAFIYYYAKLHRQAPAELDMRKYFQASPPTVHDMIVRLEKRGFISREPGKPRSIRLLLGRDALPDLE